jgi:hypothetical protein
MNESLTIASADLHLVTREDCVCAAQNALRDYKATMLCVIEFWCKPESEGGLGLPIEELAEELGKAPRTLKEYRTELYKLGRLEKTETRGGDRSKVLSGNPHKNVQPTHPEPSTNVQPTRSPVCPPFLSVVPELEPECEAGAEQFHSVPMGADDCRVISAEVVTMSDGERDFQRAEQLFAELFALSKRNFANGWTELQWNTLGGDCRTLAECCDARGKRQRSRPQRQVLTLGAN